MRYVRPGVAVAAVLGLCGGLGLLASGSAQATPTDARSARTEAHAAAITLSHLRSRLTAAVTAYDASIADVGQQVSSGIAAQELASQAIQAAQAAQDQQTDRIRALYMSDGGLGLYESLLSAGSPADLALRIQSADSIMGSTGAAVAQAEASAAAAQQQQAQVDRATASAVITADSVAARAQRIQTLVGQAQSVLDHLSARARAESEAQQAQAALDAAEAAAGADTAGAAAHAGIVPIPATYFRLYHEAALTCPGMSWTLLAAVGQVESGHGRNDGPSSAGAVGPMQFRPRTFDAYAVDGDHDGRTSPWDPADAIFTAAHFLCVGGAGSPSGVPAALLRYNNAEWYVQLVLGVESGIAAAY